MSSSIAELSGEDQERFHQLYEEYRSNITDLINLKGVAGKLKPNEKALNQNQQKKTTKKIDICEKSS